ncbi:MAG: exodeoxyribonuclease III [Nanoarchaeota archaeon]
MKICSWNINGLRSALNKGILEWIGANSFDFLCLQEIRINKIQDEFQDKNIHFNFAKTAGYAGVMTFCNKLPLKEYSKIGLDRFDDEGRFLRLDFKEFILINLYMPHGYRDKRNLNYKLDCYNVLIRYLENLLKQNKKIILAGDFNIAHEEIDLARPKYNYHNVMFTDEERKKIDLIIKLGFRDSFRILNSEQKFSWWPYFANARERNLGWRIDYIFLSKSLVKNSKNSDILVNVKGSDHCPILAEVNL